MNHEDMIQRKAEVFLEEKNIVHLKLNNGTFYNGLLFEVSKNYLIIHDREDGRKKIFLFEIKNISEYEFEVKE